MQRRRRLTYTYTDAYTYTLLLHPWAPGAAQVERLIVHRPHPWGLLITFIELIKNPRYNFWSKPFTRCAPEIERLFESVARSCMAPTAGGGVVPAAGEQDAGLP